MFSEKLNIKFLCFKIIDEESVMCIKYVWYLLFKFFIIKGNIFYLLRVL